jgi:AMP deaminase
LQVVGFDSVDDESVYEKMSSVEHLKKPPKEWHFDDSPHYCYWLYYIYVNIYTLNALRKTRGLNTLTFRPHSGESGTIDHLCSAYLLADGVNHGIRLKKAPVLQYLFYIHQIGVAVSPLSNNR